MSITGCNPRRLASPVIPTLWLLLGLTILLGMSRLALAGTILDDPILDEPILGGRLLVATDGEVKAKFLGSDAGYINTLFLNGSNAPLFNKFSPLNSETSLGTFTAGTELVFRLDVWNTGWSFFTGDAGLNPDGLAHALAVTTFNQVDGYITTVGFEDLFDGGDLDFNDFKFSLTNVIDPPGVPVPPVATLLLIGLAGIGYQRRKRIKVA